MCCNQRAVNRANRQNALLGSKKNLTEIRRLIESSWRGVQNVVVRLNTKCTFKDPKGNVVVSKREPVAFRTAKQDF